MCSFSPSSFPNPFALLNSESEEKKFSTQFATLKMAWLSEYYNP